MITNSPIYGDSVFLECLDYNNISNNYTNWMNNTEILKYTESRFTTHSRESLRIFVQEANKSSDNLLLGIFDRKTEEHLGNIKLGPINVPHRRSYIGLIIGQQSRWNQGVGSQSISLLTAFAHDTLDLDMILAGIYSTNIASRRAFEKSGYFEISRIPDFWLTDSGSVDEVIYSSSLTRTIAPIGRA